MGDGWVLLTWSAVTMAVENPTMHVWLCMRVLAMAVENPTMHVWLYVCVSHLGRLTTRPCMCGCVYACVLTLAVENSIMRISSPCDDEKAVAST